MLNGLPTAPAQQDHHSGKFLIVAALVQVYRARLPADGVYFRHQRLQSLVNFLPAFRLLESHLDDNATFEIGET